MFDAHCHLHDRRMENIRDAAIARARAVGINGFMLAGVDPEDWRAAMQVTQRHSECLLSYGIHPRALASASPVERYAMFEQLVIAVRGEQGWMKPHAIGEIGLDVATPSGQHTMAPQEEYLRMQLAHARSVDLPIVLHVVSAHARILEILSRDGLPRAGGVVHSYSGGVGFVDAYLRLGLYISFTGRITAPQSHRLRRAAQRVPSDRLLVETDAPDQPLYGHHGALNEPAHLPEIIQSLAQARGVAVIDMVRLTTRNAQLLFGVHVVSS